MFKAGYQQHPQRAAIERTGRRIVAFRSAADVASHKRPENSNMVG